MGFEPKSVPDYESSNPEEWPDPLDKNLQHFVDYWRSLKPSADGIPKRNDVRPREMVQYLPSIMILERVIEDGKERFRYRLTGEDARAVSGRNIRGTYVDELFSEDVTTESHNIFNRVLKTGEPNFSIRHSPVHDRDFIHYQRIIAPLLDNNGEANVLIGLWVWEWVKPL